jgi:NAD(P)-dependent dehydrogenase (short-subunit alcohol dehydrogenase family)
MLLENKNAIVYGAAGAVGSAVARRFAAEGARVYLAGRTRASLEVLAKEINAAGVAVVDALDEAAVRRHADEVAAAGGIDVSFNAVGVASVQGRPLRDLSLDDFTAPIQTYTRTHFLTATAAGRHMAERGRGVIVTLSTTAAKVAFSTDGFGVACAAVEALARQLAGELGPYGVRVVCLRADAIPESVLHGSHVAEIFRSFYPEDEQPTDQELAASDIGAGGALLGRAPTLADVANVAAFLASDQASAMTATITNVTGGSVID